MEEKIVLSHCGTKQFISLGDSVTTHGPIVEGQACVREEPFSLPQGFSWDTLDLTSTTVVGYQCNT